MLNEYNSFYIVGIGGISMSAIAKLLLIKNKKIYGSDITPSSLIDELREKGIEIKIGGAPEYVLKSEALIITGAISDDNADLLYAKKLGKPIFNRAEVLGELTKDMYLISVAGTHGKTTTTGMLASALIEAQQDPTVHIGGILSNINSNLRVGKSNIFLTEACEYQDSFLKLNSDISIILNIQEDHLDYFKNLNNIYKSFNEFASNTKHNGVVIYNFDELSNKLWLKTNSLSFGFQEDADVKAKNVFEYTAGKFQFDLYFKKEYAVTIKLNCYGIHNVKNALAAAAVMLYLQIAPSAIKHGIESFKGIKRRFEIINENEECKIIHDYAHHPTEIKATLSVCREIAKTGKIVSIFQPHTYTRTRDLFDDFSDCFAQCDEVWLLPIYPAREKPITGITSQALCDNINKKGKKCRYFSDFSACEQEISSNIDEVSLFIILGAGDIEKLAYSLKSI